MLAVRVLTRSIVTVDATTMAMARAIALKTRVVRFWSSMVPHFGQGAGQAIEDGFALAVLLEHAKRDEIPSRLKAYQELRLERTSRVQAASRLAGKFYRFAPGDPLEQADRMREWMSAAAWIFPHDAEKAALALL